MEINMEVFDIGECSLSLSSEKKLAFQWHMDIEDPMVQSKDIEVSIFFILEINYLRDILSYIWDTIIYHMSVLQGFK